VADTVASDAITVSGDISVLIVDDQRLVGSGFAVTLGTETGITVEGEASDGEEAVALARRLAPSVVLLDIRMPNIVRRRPGRRCRGGRCGPAIAPFNRHG
jgi:DNA-binding NarL/FixJ family response regulator